MRTDDGLEALAARGAETLATRCLAVQPGEHVRLFHHGTTLEHRLVTDALRAAGAVVRDVDLAGPSFPTDDRLAEAELRAEPDVIRRINDRLIALLTTSRRLEMTSEAATDLDVAIGVSYPLVADCGRPAPGGWDNLPTGFVYFHPASMRGTFVVDRVLLGTGVERSGERLRAAGLLLTFSGGRVTGMACRDEVLRCEVDAYLASAPNAARAGFVSVPTNYLALAELGQPNHGGLLPGARIQLGFSDSRNTRAPWDMDGGLRLAGRKNDAPDRYGDDRRSRPLRRRARRRNRPISRRRSLWQPVTG